MYVTDPKTGRQYVSKRRRRPTGDRCPHELTFSCFKRYRFLDRDRTRDWFVEELQNARQKWPIDVWAYVIMPEHVHLLVAPRRRNKDVTGFAGGMKQTVSRRAVKWLQENSPEWIPRITVIEGGRQVRRFWQPGGGYDRSVEQLRTLKSMIDYIHANPVRRGLVERPEDWKWSSAQWYAGRRPVLIEMDATLPTFHE
jgi:putative transposase